jgi:predicted SAM-dependent methyltransferase
MGEVNFPANSFDAIVSFYAIFHIPRDEHPALLKKLYNLLKPDGYLLITMGSTSWEGTAENFHGVKMFWSHYGAAKNKQLIKQAGFEIIVEKIDTSGGERHLVILAKKN